jgi:hypothetical protein
VDSFGLGIGYVLGAELAISLNNAEHNSLASTA